MNVTSDWLKSIGIYTDEVNLNEHSVRIRGGSDNGWKEDSDADKDGDEIIELVIVVKPTECWCYVEGYTLPNQNTEEIIYLGERHTQEEILELCRALKAWGITYST